jgi:hypothetical protein
MINTIIDFLKNMIFGTFIILMLNILIDRIGEYMTKDSTNNNGLSTQSPADASQCACGKTCVCATTEPPQEEKHTCCGGGCCKSNKPPQIKFIQLIDADTEHPQVYAVVEYVDGTISEMIGTEYQTGLNGEERTIKIDLDIDLDEGDMYENNTF